MIYLMGISLSYCAQPLQRLLLDRDFDNYIVSKKFKDFVPGDVLPGILDWLGLPPTGILMGPESYGNMIIENMFTNVPFPIEDMGTDNVIEDNIVQ